ncbi:tyrosine-type recombinase/integrase [Lacrimispora defluvii]|uniref:Site-specific integrase n=1 Tax=Lacrimispora defluvii TaxID=2719233 RepID=A0ABX1VTG2_9FIRM|nr:site-specific integrase [Lacrimispora defluvii]NNJ31668.1 site-specific integrase [Lacrimispora defluvii]
MPRRGENIYKRKDGRWEGRTLKQTGKYQYFYSKSYKGVKEKMKNYKENQAPAKEKRSDEIKGGAALFEEWLIDVSIRVKPSTYESYYRCLNKYVIPFFEKEKDQRITMGSVARFVKEMYENEELADSSKKKNLTIFKIAVKEILKGSADCFAVMDLIKYPKPDDKEVEVFSMKEQRQIEQTAFHYNDRRAMGILLCFYTGIRLGELCALKWGDIDMETGTLSISRTVSRIRHFEEEEHKTALFVGAPKSRKSMRKIPLPQFLLNMPVLTTYKSRNQDNYIFTQTNIPFDPRCFQKLYKRLLKEAHVKDRKFHAIRHTFATRALELGVDIKTISELLGHSSVSITLNVYAHSLMEQKKAAIEKFNDMYQLNADLSGPLIKNNYEIMEDSYAR